MKQKIVLHLLLIVFFGSGCSFGKQSDDGLPYIDVTKKYEEKEIILTDIADINYLHLSTEDDDFIFKGRISCITKNVIVVFDQSSGNILFFSRDGSPRSCFNHSGSGPEEYPVFVNKITYDEVTDEVFVVPSTFNYIQVYSSIGEFKRKLVLPQDVNITQLVSFDNQSLLIYDDKPSKRRHREFIGDEPDSIPQLNDSTFILISKIDGKILDYVNMPNKVIDLSVVMGKGTTTKCTIGFARILKCAEGLLLSNPEADTVFLYDKNKSLTPVIHKIPLVNDLDPKIVLENCMVIGQYQFMAINPICWEKDFIAPRKFYMRDKKTNEVFRPKFVLPDYKDREFEVYLRPEYFFENEYNFELDLMELKQAYDENRLSGKLKDLVATLDESKDNNVFMLVRFK